MKTGAQKQAPLVGVHSPLRSASGLGSAKRASLRQSKGQVRRSLRESQNSVQAAAADVIDNAVATNSAGAFTTDVSEKVLGIILGGGAGTRLYPLTKARAKPAVPLGGNYRLIDIPISNCLNSHINKIYVLTQFNSASLNRHILSAYNSSGQFPSDKGFVEVLAATQNPTSFEWFQGTADAVRQYDYLFQEYVDEGVEHFIILSGDQLYRMDYRHFVQKHIESNADITVAALPCDEERASAFGLMKIDDDGRILEFSEKPEGDALKAMQVDTTVLGLDEERAKMLPYIASMGIYVIKADVVKQLLDDDFPDANDFGGEVIPGATANGMRVQAFLFDGYWEDIGTVGAFYQANLQTTELNPPFSFNDEVMPMYSNLRYLPPSKIVDAEIVKSVVGDGCFIRGGSKVQNSVIGLRTLVGENCLIEDSLIMGADYYETLEECAIVPGCLPMGIGIGTVIRKAIVDKNARIGSNVKLINKEGIQEATNTEELGYVIKDGIIVVIKNSQIEAGTVI